VPLTRPPAGVGCGAMIKPAMLRATIVLLAIIPLTQASWAAEEPTTLRGYLALVERYRTHDPSRTAAGREALQEIVRWDLGEARWSLTQAGRLSDTYGRRVQAAGDEEEIATGGPLKTSHRPSAVPGGATPVLSESEAAFCAAALLHTEVSVLELRSGHRALARFHREMAWQLLCWLPRSPASLAFQRKWVVAVSSLLRADGSLDSARRLTLKGLERLPKDGPLLLAAAAASEAVATLCFEPEDVATWNAACVDSLAGRGRELQLTKRGLRPPRTPHRAAIEKQTRRFLRRVLAAQPNDPEVRLRMGHALAQLGQDEAAQRELRWVVLNASAPRHVALSHLLLAEIARGRQDALAEVEHARYALVAAPESQSARVALAAALLSRGDRDAAARTMAELPSRFDAPEDLWLKFLLGSPDAYAAARDVLYARVRRR
jgi:hypothetical protein